MASLTKVLPGSLNHSRSLLNPAFQGHPGYPGACVWLSRSRWLKDYPGIVLITKTLRGRPILLFSLALLNTQNHVWLKTKDSKLILTLKIPYILRFLEDWGLTFSWCSFRHWNLIAPPLLPDSNPVSLGFFQLGHIQQRLFSWPHSIPHGFICIRKAFIYINI